jgi:hypothetical protein
MPIDKIISTTNNEKYLVTEMLAGRTLDALQLLILGKAVSQKLVITGKKLFQGLRKIKHCRIISIIQSSCIDANTV